MADFDGATVTIPDEDIIDYVVSNFRPHEIFPIIDLEIWALNNGFITLKTLSIQEEMG